MPNDPATPDESPLLSGLRRLLDGRPDLTADVAFVDGQYAAQIIRPTGQA